MAEITLPARTGRTTGSRPSNRLRTEGKVPATEAVDNRLVAAPGPSRLHLDGRDGSRLCGRTLGAVTVMDRSTRSPYDREHAIGHVLGGVLDLLQRSLLLPVEQTLTRLPAVLELM